MNEYRMEGWKLLRGQEVICTEPRDKLVKGKRYKIHSLMLVNHMLYVTLQGFLGYEYRFSRFKIAPSIKSVEDWE